MVQGTGKMVQPSKCLSYQGFELSSDFYEKVLVKVQREFKNSSSYWKFELSGMYCNSKNHIQMHVLTCTFLSYTSKTVLLRVESTMSKEKSGKKPHTSQFIRVSPTRGMGGGPQRSKTCSLPPSTWKNPPCPTLIFYSLLNNIFQVITQ